MIVVFQNGNRYKLDTSLNTNDRIVALNNILAKENFLIEKYWETNKTKTILDILSTYIYNGGEEQEYSVLSTRQMKARNGEVEIPIDFTRSSSEGLILSFKENHKRKGKKSFQKYQTSNTHKLTTVKIPPEERLNRKIGIESTISTHRFSIKDGQLNYSNDMKYYEIDVFTPEDKNLPYINPSLPYLYSWAIVNEDNEFFFNGEKFKINDENYSFDKVLCYYQLDKIFLNPNINLINDLITTVYN